MTTRGSISAGTAFFGELQRVVAEDSESEPQIAADLCARIHNGSRDAEDQMVRRYGAGLLRLLKLRTRDAELALDLRQDTLRVAIERLRRSMLEDPTGLAAYLRSVALNLLIAQRRKDTRRATAPDSIAIENAADERGGPFDNVSREQLRHVVGVLLNELNTPRDRDLLTRFYIRDEDKATICAALSVDSVHFNRVLFRAKQRFRELLLQAERRSRPVVG
ncbi:MAG TPA: sigma-70 family RNA polymerase sigma factor [Gammaproteobacteria bacterium]|nr:sigma-70 family RNA polymerase sigma factor [Gammaproteobacteria bacterium]